MPPSNSNDLCHTSRRLNPPRKNEKKRKKKKVAVISFINSWISNNSRAAVKNIKKEFFFCLLFSNILPFRFVVHYFRSNMFFVHEQGVMVRVKGGSWTNRGKNGPLKKKKRKGRESLFMNFLRSFDDFTFV